MAAIHIGEVEVENIEDDYLFHVQLWLNRINPDDVSVKLYASGINAETSEKINGDGFHENNGAYNFHTLVNSA